MNNILKFLLFLLIASCTASIVVVTGDRNEVEVQQVDKPIPDIEIDLLQKKLINRIDTIK